MGDAAECPLDSGWNPEERLDVESPAERTLHLRSELGTSVRDNVSGDAMQAKHVLDQEVCGLS